MAASTLVLMDSYVSIQDQINDKTHKGPVVLMNKFNVDPKDAETMLASWTVDAKLMMKQPGALSTQLHRGIGGSGCFINYAVWQSVEAYKNAFQNPEFKKQMSHYPPGALMSPGLFEKVVVPGVCDGKY